MNDYTPVEEHVKMSEELEKRKIFLDEGNISFDRYLSTIDTINAKILSLCGTFFVLVTLQITILVFLFQSKSVPSSFSFFSFAVIVFITFIGVILFSKQILAKRYSHIKIFERYEDLLKLNRIQILDDFIKNTQTAYEDNQRNYHALSKGLQYSIGMVISNIIAFIFILVLYYFI